MYAQTRLFTDADGSKQDGALAGRVGSVGSTYGPASDTIMQVNQPLQEGVQQERPSRSYGISIKRDCNKDDEDRDL